MEVMQTWRHWVDDRTPRERIMLAGCGLLVLLVVGWLVVYQPVHAWRAEMAAALQTAVADEARVANAIISTRPVRPAFEGDLEALVNQTAQEHGLVAVLGMSESGDLAFRFETAPVQAVMSWLSALEAAGVRVTAISVVENADATVAAEGAVSASN